jgi:predicted nucleotide-binding protein
MAAIEHRLDFLRNLNVEPSEAHRLIDLQASRGNELLARTRALNSATAYGAWKLDHARWVSLTAQTLDHVYHDDVAVKEFSNAMAPGFLVLTDSTWQEALENVAYRTKESINTLVSLTERLHLASQPESVPITSSAPTSSATSVDADGPIFVVHGHDESMLQYVVRVLERSTGRDVVVLREKANGGLTLLEKFERHAETAAYAVVLLTADDEGGARTEVERRHRGRQNVVFELGFFFGQLGRSRVAVLYEASVEWPSDLEGLVYIELDHPGAWKQALARELVAVGITVDFERIP